MGSDDKIFFTFTAFVIFLFVATTIGLCKVYYDKGYTDACKDFYKGKLKYDLIENSDGTREWKKIK
jgi:hypothetical protein